jgi:UPF0755 protein
VLRWLALLALVAAAAVAGTAAVLYREVAAFRDMPFGDPAEKVVELPPGTGPRQAIRLLASAGILSDERLARRYVRWVKRDPRQMKAGEYSFAGPLRPDEVLEKLYRGEVKTYQFTVPEGLRMEEIAAIVEAAGLGRASELLPLMKDAAFARELGVPASSLEGYLFPDTYTFTRNPKPRAVVTAMVSRFKQAWREADAQRLPGIALDQAQAVTLASIVEKETGRPEERPRIACVFHNRLRRGMRLQTDPTVMYATMLRLGRWSQNISKSDLETPHPYNTYLVAGLPPGPIASPGGAALRAALHPASCDDLFFVSRNDGTHVFCPDLACHEAAVRRWQVEYFRRAPRPARGAVPGEPQRAAGRAP